MTDWLDVAETTPPVALASHWASQPPPEDAPAVIHSRLLSFLYVDRPRAATLGDLAARLAVWRGDSLSAAFAARCDGHLRYLAGDHAAAATAYARAAALFEEAGQDSEVARTLSSGIQALSYLGRYDEARAWADRAAAIFTRLGDHLRLARLDSNVGNLLFRQDQPAAAMARYERALAGFRQAGQPSDVAAVLSNLAVCRTNLGQFATAMADYREARDYCAAHGLAALAGQADYNIAYLFYLRGDYTEARRQYAVSRERSLAARDAYHAALCDLDEAEMALELNLSEDGAALARRAESVFAANGFRYEQAKALVNLAVSASQLGDPATADRHLLRALRLFRREGNALWPALVDQLRAVLAFHAGRLDAARRLSARAWRSLRDTPIPGRAAHSRLLLARLWLRQGDSARARLITRETLARLGEAVSPSLRFHANLLEGEICERQGKPDGALRAYEAARQDIEDLRGRVDSEDLRISLLKDKLSVYDALCALYLAGDCGPDDVLRAFALVQQAKSRSLADRVAAARLDAPDSVWSELRWLYRQANLGATLQRAGIVAPGARDIQDRIRRLEAELETHAHPASSPAEVVAELRAALPEGAVYLEYFQARDAVYLFLLGPAELRVVPLGPAAAIRHAMRLLHFQLSKPRLGLPHEGAESANRHLRELYRLLIAPAAEGLAAYRHLVVAPHRDFHGLPFAALNDGDRPLMDRFTVSRTPSAAVFAACRRRPRKPLIGSLVLATPDHRAPDIAGEAREVAALLPQSRLLLGEEASLDAFRDLAPAARIVHLAAHGDFRRDNPAFSSLRLAGGGLGVLDLQEMDLAMDLLTLSGCNTGSSVPVGADELQGLLRGFLTAGARSVLAAIWEIDDASAREFMRSFYRRLREGQPLPVALRLAMNDLRERYPHPFYWAPYVLFGDPEAL